MDASLAQSVSAAEITRNFGMWQDRAAHGPLVVTHHGRPRVMILSIDEYDAMVAHGPAKGVSDNEAEARLSVVLDHLISGFVAFDAELCFRRVNVVASAYFERSEEGLLGQMLTEVFPALEDSVFVSHLRHVLRSGEEVSFDAPAQMHLDRLLRYRLFAYPGGVAALFTNVADQVGQRRDAAEQVSLADARTAHGGVGVARLSMRGTFEEVDASLAAIAGFAAARLTGVRFGDLLALNRRAVVADEIEAVLTGSGARAFDSVMLVNGGADLSIRVALAEIRDGFAISGATLLVTPALQ